MIFQWKLLVGLVACFTFLIEQVKAQNTRDAKLKYDILNTTPFVNKIDLTNSLYSLYYGVVINADPNLSKIYFYLVRNPQMGSNVNVNIEIIFGSSQQSVYSAVLTRTYNVGTSTYSCSTQDKFYTNGVPAVVATTTINDVCGNTGANIWDQKVRFQRLLKPANGFEIKLDTPMNIQFIEQGGTPQTYTITLYSTKYCHGVCGDSQCDGPLQDDCTSCKDPLRVAVHNRCIQRDPLPLSPPNTQIWNKQEFMQDKFNASLYYGFRREQNVDYCYFRLVVNQTMIPATPQVTPTWLGFSFQNTHKYPGTLPYNDMVIIRYNGDYTSTTQLLVEDYHSRSTATFTASTSVNFPQLDTAQNYVLANGGYDGSSKWDVTIIRMCNLNDLTTFDAASQAQYLNASEDLLKVISCDSTSTCTYSSSATPYYFSIVVGSNPWKANMADNKHYDKITQKTYPTNNGLVNVKYCPTCVNVYADCVGPERQDCTTCNTATEEFDPRYPSSGPGICIVKIPPCHSDCVYQQCDSSYNDGCKACSDPTKFLYLGISGLSGRCITSKTLFWNKVDLGTPLLSFYYGWDSSFEFIYFKFVGTIQGWAGVLFNKDKNVPFATAKDNFKVVKASPIVPVDSSCTNNCFQTAGDAYQNVALIPSSYWSATEMNVIVSRQANTGQTDDALINDSYEGITVFYDATSTNPASGTAVAKELPTQKFYKTQKCATNCSAATCSGPETTDCLTCNSGYALASSAPSQCVQIISTGCNASCKTCQSVNTSKCITCASIIQVVYDGTCISKYPVSWNKIYFSSANFTLYYGFDAAKTNVYFRVTGKNNGWIGFGFMDRNLNSYKHTNTDMMILRKENGSILIEDRLSLTQSEPVLDTNVSGKNNLQYIQGDRDNEGYWDLYFVRACNTGDTQAKDFVIQPNIYFYLTFAYGPSDILTGHSQYFPITTIFKDTQICDQTCTTCTGPEVYQCTSCPSGFALQSSSPSPCVLSQTTCYQTCKTCTGPTISDCITCTNANYIQAGGLCISNSPSFWNKVPITGSNLILYYGYDTALQNIYFRLKGSGPAGWLGMAFQKTKEKMDMIVLRMVSGNLIIEDKYTESHNYLPSDDNGQGGSKNYFYISGGRTNANDWDVTFMRMVSTTDTKFDSVIDSRTYSLSFAYGASDAFDKHSSFYTLDNIHFLTKQVCDSTCLSCSGPEPTNCLTCPSGQKLSGTAPSSCVNPGVTCHINCATCTGPGQSECIKCASVDKISYNGNCISNAPNVWNRIDVKANFVLYYGYDAGGSYIYFRAVGTSPGWFGVGFNDGMINTDMHIVRIPSTTVEVEDRYSLGHVLPLEDLQDNTVLIKGTLVGSQLDCTWVRSTISTDTTYDVPLSFDISRNLVFAFGSTQVFNKHTEVYTKKGITFSRSQQCSSGCLKCTGPDPANCTQQDTTNTSISDSDKVAVDWNFSNVLKALTCFYLILALLFV